MSVNIKRRQKPRGSGTQCCARPSCASSSPGAHLTTRSTELSVWNPQYLSIEEIETFTKASRAGTEILRHKRKSPDKTANTFAPDRFSQTCVMRHCVTNFDIRTSAILVWKTICMGFLDVIFAEQWTITLPKLGGCASASADSSTEVRGGKKVSLIKTALANPVCP
jgi:hypothetical protein